MGLADRLDTISGCFSIGLVPTGAADPFALRRHALAVIRILEDRKWDLSLQAIIRRSLEILHEGIDFDMEEVFQKILLFFRERYKNLMSRSGYESDLIEAVISADFDRISHLGSKIDDP